MKPCKGKALSWNLSDGVIELAMHLPPANEMGRVMLAEFDQFHLALQAATDEASVLIIYSQLKAGFSAGGDLREMYIRLQKSSPAEISLGIRDSLVRNPNLTPFSPFESRRLANFRCRLLRGA
jgi:enoyl-CoA hydratase/carnithine racemase